MKEMLLLGAGASKEAGVPMAYGLTERIATEFRENRRLKRYWNVVSFVLGGLLFNRGIRGEDPLTSGVNVEEFFNAIQLLANRGSLEAAPFVGSWHAKIEEFDQIRPVSNAERLQEIIFKSVTAKIFDSIPANPSSFITGDIDRKLEELIRKSAEAAMKGRSLNAGSSCSIGKEVGMVVMEVVNKWAEKLRQSRPSGGEFDLEFQRAADQQPRPGDGKVFKEVADRMIQMLVKFVVVRDPANVTYLQPLNNLLRRQPRLTVASLNYDNCVEVFCESNEHRYDSGIEEWSRSGTFDMEGDGVLLLKLHGSIDWQTREGQSAERPMPQKIISRAHSEDMGKSGYWPAVIFGQRNKLTAEGPFLDLLRAFQRELVLANQLTVIGYSFADAHINVLLSNWLNGNSGRTIRIVNPAAGSGMCPYVDELLRYARSQVTVVKAAAGTGLREIYDPILDAKV